MRSVKEERINALTHGAGIAFGLISIPFLIYYSFKTGNNAILAGSIVYGLSFLFVYSASTIFHAINKPRYKRTWRKIDHISIYFLISGTYTPFVLIYLNNSKGFALLAVLWALTLIGMCLKIFLTGKFDNISTFIYLLMGWSMIFVAKSFFTAVPFPILLLIITGGILYSAGVYFYLKDQRPYYHGIWHIFVLAAGVFHFFGVFAAVV